MTITTSQFPAYTSTLTAEAFADFSDMPMAQRRLIVGAFLEEQVATQATAPQAPLPTPDACSTCVMEDACVSCEHNSFDDGYSPPMDELDASYEEQYGEQVPAQAPASTHNVIVIADYKHSYSLINAHGGYRLRLRIANKSYTHPQIFTSKIFCNNFASKVLAKGIIDAFNWN